MTRCAAECDIPNSGPICRIVRFVRQYAATSNARSVLLFTLVATWNNYFPPLIMLNAPQWFPVTVGLAQWNAQASGGGGAQALFSIVITGSLLAIVPLVAAFLLLQRYWQSGLGVGGVKE